MGSPLTESEAEKLMKENNNKKDLFSPLIDSFPCGKFHANNKSFIFCLPSWQLGMLLHSLTTALVPLQFFPPCAGSGLAHSLILVCMPLTVLVQRLHWLHLLQPPSTYK